MSKLLENRKKKEKKVETPVIDVTQVKYVEEPHMVFEKVVALVQAQAQAQVVQEDKEEKKEEAQAQAQAAHQAQKKKVQHKLKTESKTKLEAPIPPSQSRTDALPLKSDEIEDPKMDNQVFLRLNQTDYETIIKAWMRQQANRKLSRDYNRKKQNHQAHKEFEEPKVSLYFLDKEVGLKAPIVGRIKV